jgi:hypothetical protein
MRCRTSIVVSGAALLLGEIGTPEISQLTSLPVRAAPIENSFPPYLHGRHEAGPRNEMGGAASFCPLLA